MQAEKHDDGFDFTTIYNLVTEPEQYDTFMRELLDKLDIVEQAESKVTSAIMAMIGCLRICSSPN